MAKTNRKRKQSVAKMSRQIRLEAKALGLTEREYLRLTLALSKALRESFGASSELNTKEFLSFVESPMFSILLRGIVQTALSTITRGASETEDTPDGPPTNPAESPHPSLQAPPGRPEPPRPNRMYPEWGYGYRPPQAPPIAQAQPPQGAAPPSPRQLQSAARAQFWP
ncbi:hypothetical protein NZD89_19225 [Alicyclobacillus fastidiosus]|uniref:Uncharacterized protein n=1 Tax=Alicyclobacillus fastidiosus TaxID=392011 RepID=A0ABY6ZC80_9BACL|nr:hypothetical protein [Alicyclobacillus fastidiosus]WAH40449.1 hypothetical protein NZD89_19225 [Alicyclobacillus fastidiosus]